MKIFFGYLFVPIFLCCIVCAGSGKLVHVEVNTLGINRQTNQSSEANDVYCQFINQLVNKLNSNTRYPETKLFDFSSDSLLKIAEYGKGKNALRTYVPPHVGVEIDGYKPDAILFIKSFAAVEKEKESSGPIWKNIILPIPAITNAVMKYNAEYSLNYYLWDNKTGKIIFANKLFKKIKGGETGPGSEEQLKLADGFAVKIFESLKVLLKQ
jgi:hypothetical protein